MRRTKRVLLTKSLFWLPLIALVPLAAPAQSVATSTPTGLSFMPVTPCRVADTRGATGTFGGPALVGNAAGRSFPIPSSTCGIPGTAQAYALNLTVVPHGSLGFLTAFPCGQPRPVASNLNSIDGRVKAVGAIVPAGAGGAVCVFASNTTDFVMDINGYFVPDGSDPSALSFYPLTPCRVADTRTARGPLGGPFLIERTTRAFPVLLSACGAPLTAQAYSLNYTVVSGGNPFGYLTTWPAGDTQPLVSTLNAPTGTVTANAAIVAAGVDGNVDVFPSNSADLVIDMDGYFAPPGAGGLSLFPVTPCRVLDTRKASGPFSGQLDMNVLASPCNGGGTLAAADAFVLNATVVPAGSLGYLTLWPKGVTQPFVSTLNALDGAITSNLALVPTTNGAVSAFAPNATQLVLDISGYLGPPGGAPLMRVSGPSPFAADCLKSSASNTEYHNAEVEPFIAVNPKNPNNVIGVWQQDRWSAGAASGIVTGSSQDGGKTWSSTFATFTFCSGGTTTNGGDFNRASDPWVAFGPDGTAYQVVSAFNGDTSAILVSSSSDGGATWSAPTALNPVTNPNQFNDKPAVTADPTRPGNVYVSWGFFDYTCSSNGDVSFAFTRSTDGGTTWDPVRIVSDPGCNNVVFNNIIEVLPDGTLVDLCWNGRSDGSAANCALRSTDAGLTWGPLITVSTFQEIGAVDVKTGEPVRGSQTSVAVDHTSGTLYVVWQDARFSAGQRDGIVMSKSTDGGLTWSAPVQVNQAPNVQAFIPSVDVADDGTVGITYYDFRYDTDAPGTLLTSTWLITSHDGGTTWQETAIAPPFDIRSAPNSGGFFVGDYEGLAHAGTNFLAFFSKANIHDTSNPTDVFVFNAQLAGLSAISATTSPPRDGRVEINRHPKMRLELEEREHAKSRKTTAFVP